MILLRFTDRGWCLQNQINTLQKFCTLSGMQVNASKTQIIVFRNGGIVKSNEKWFLNAQELEVVPYYKYLGLFFSSRLNWSYATKCLSVQSNKALYMIRMLQNKCHNLPPEVLFEIFDTVVAPTVTYASEIWGYKIYNSIENVQLKFCRQLLGLGSNTPNVAVLGECGRFPLFVTYYTKCVKYWLKLVTMETGELPKSAYKMALVLCEAGKNNWSR